MRVPTGDSSIGQTLQVRPLRIRNYQISIGLCIWQLLIHLKVSKIPTGQELRGHVQRVLKEQRYDGQN
jgi:hypothetical protein